MIERIVADLRTGRRYIESRSSALRNKYQLSQVLIIEVAVTIGVIVSARAFDRYLIKA